MSNIFKNIKMRDKKAIPFFVLSFLFLTAFSVLIYTVNRGDSFDSRSKASILELPEEYKKADFNGDGKVSMVDFGLWLTYFRNFKSNGYGYKEIDAGDIHTCGLGDHGQAYCWGWGGKGQLGNGDNVDSNTPVAVKQGMIPSTVKLISINTGSYHTCGLDGNGQAYCWGWGGNGQLGNGGDANSNTPVAVKLGEIPSAVKLIIISANGGSTGLTCGLGGNGQAYCWGSGSNGQLGNGGDANSNTPVAVKLGEIPSTVKLISINTGGSHTCGLGDNGQAYCWGSGGNGQLGNGGNTSSNTPVAVKLGEIPSTVKLISINTGGSHTCGLGDNGQAYCWGKNEDGQLGNGDNVDSNTPVAVKQGMIPSTVKLISINTGSYHTCGLDGNGQAYCWGWGGNGQLGNGGDANSNTPVAVKLGEIPSTVKLISINTGGSHTCGLGDNGQAYCWGSGGNGQLGNGGNTSSNTPVEVKQGEYLLHGDLNDDNRISMEDFRIWLDIYRKYKGEMKPPDEEVPPGETPPGVELPPDEEVPPGEDMPPGEGLTSTLISVGSRTTCNINGDGQAYCWGFGFEGQLGNGKNVNSNEPVLVVE